MCTGAGRGGEEDFRNEEEKEKLPDECRMIDGDRRSIPHLSLHTDTTENDPHHAY